jgi:phosphate/sulfate permease
MKLSIPTGIVVAVIAWIVLYVIIGIPLWVAFVVAGGIIAAAVVAAGGEHVARS